MDPETGLDALRNLGILRGEIAAISEEPLRGELMIDASGLVVAPGFIDLHAHGQDNVSNKSQALDGVTTALEMEVGVFPVADWLATREGQAILNFGATVGHWGARVALVDDLVLGHFPTQPRNVIAEMDRGNYAYEVLPAERLERLAELVDRGLDEGGLGIGFGVTYTPGASRSCGSSSSPRAAACPPTSTCEAKTPAARWAPSRRRSPSPRSPAPRCTSST